MMLGATLRGKMGVCEKFRLGILLCAFEMPAPYPERRIEGESQVDRKGQ